MAKELSKIEIRLLELSTEKIASSGKSGSSKKTVNVNCFDGSLNVSDTLQKQFKHQRFVAVALDGDLYLTPNENGSALSTVKVSKADLTALGLNKPHLSIRFHAGFDTISKSIKVNLKSVDRAKDNTEHYAKKGISFEVKK